MGVVKRPSRPEVAVVVASSNANVRVKSRADYICDGVEDEVQINAAIQALSTNGGTVKLTEGAYIINSSILPEPNVNIVGAGYSTHLSMTRTDLSRAVISINPNSTQGGTATLDEIIEFNILIKDLRISGPGKTLYGSIPNQRGVYGYCAKGIVIDNCYISDVASSGIALQQCPEYKITRCTVHDVGYNCIGNGEWLAQNAIVTNNILYNSGVGYCGVEVNGSDRIIVANNIIYGCSYGIRCFSGSEGCIGRDVVITGNDVRRCGLRGIYVLNTYEVNITNNNVKHITGGITSVTVTNSGSGYSDNPTISIATGAGSGASLTANLTGGVITSVTVNNGGSGYVLADLIVTGASGQGAILKPTITAGAIASVEVINGGADYTSPVITISPGVGGGFTGVATVSGGAITAITVTNSGYGYPASASVVVTITDDTGTGATATAISATSGYGGIDLENGTRCAVTGNEIAYCASNGIYLQRSTWNLISNNNIHDNRLIDTSSDGIKLADKSSIASSYNSIVGNKCYDRAIFGASRQRYGINLIGAADYNNIQNNDLYGNQTAALGNTSTGTHNTIKHNNGDTTNSDIDTDGTLAANSDTIIPSQKAVKTYADTKAPALGADDNYVTDAEKTVIGNTSGTNTGDRTLVCCVSINHGAVAWTNQPAALTEIFGNTNRRTKVDLSGFLQCRISVAVTSAGLSGSKLKIQYSTNESSWSDLTTTALIDATGVKVSTWQDIPSDAKADVFIRGAGIDGDGAADPSLGTVMLQVK